YYAVNTGRRRGVFETWEECKDQVYQFKGAKYRKFDNSYDAHVYAYGRLGAAVDFCSSLPAYAQPKTFAIYTDGASRGNQNQDRAIAGYGVFFGDGDKRNVAEPLIGSSQTNQRAELTAIDVALKTIIRRTDYDCRYVIRTDSQYAIDCLTKWNTNWERKGWLNEQGQAVANQDIIRRTLRNLNTINEVYRSKGWLPIAFEKVEAHSGDHGNNMADRLANFGCDQ
ncbi:hypothetical protein CANARDRAFT_185049, partial [[Candida] arabinofermentans NRRL YB-2248]